MSKMCHIPKLLSKHLWRRSANLHVTYEVAPINNVARMTAHRWCKIMTMLLPQPNYIYWVGNLAQSVKNITGMLRSEEKNSPGKDPWHIKPEWHQIVSCWPIKDTGCCHGAEANEPKPWGLSMPALQYNVLQHLPKVNKEQTRMQNSSQLTVRKESKNAELFTAHCEGGVVGWGVLLLLLNSPTELIAVQQWNETDFHHCIPAQLKLVPA